MRKRTAFTLIEILIVIFIISLLAVIAVSSFGVARQKARMTIMVDTLINTVKERQNLAKSGKGESAMCYGISIDTSEDGPAQLKLVTLPYVSVSIETETVDFCDVSDSSKVMSQNFDLLENFKILDVTAFGVAGNSGYVLMFKPPKADVNLGPDLENLTSLRGVGGFSDSLIKIELQSPDGLEKRTVGLDTATGRVYEIIADESNES